MTIAAGFRFDVPVRFAEDRLEVLSTFLAGDAPSVPLIGTGDGVATRFPLVKAYGDGLVYRGAPGMLPSAISISDGFDIDTLDVSGALAGDAITQDDLLAGRWDGAAVRLFGVDWETPGGGQAPLARGVLGDVGVRDGAFRAELSGPTALLERPAVEATSPECRAELGDRRCRVDMAGRVRTARIASVVDAVTLTVDATEPLANAYSYGTLRFLDGANSALSEPILRSDGASERRWHRGGGWLVARSGRNDLVGCARDAGRALPPPGARCAPRCGHDDRGRLPFRRAARDGRGAGR